MFGVQFIKHEKVSEVTSCTDNWDYSQLGQLVEDMSILLLSDFTTYKV